MSSDLAVQVAELGKCYHIYNRPQDRLRQILWRGRKKFHREFWALHDVSFEVRRGETFGIIGRNGSGKSTLLQVISGTLTPTQGEVRVSGQVAALLELGAGFSPDFTGRENVYMNATLLGLTPDDIAERFDTIAAFADIGEFLDQPVRTYSSGMYVRLAFAVAFHVDPEILIVDEALSVGDMLFQFKCFLKFQELQARGKTILFVSHDMNTVKKYCSRAILLESGRLVFNGSPNDAVNQYTRLLFPEGQQAVSQPAKAPQPTCEEAIETSGREYRYGSGEGEIAQIALRNSEGALTTAFSTGEQMKVIFRVVARRSIDHPILAMTIKDVKGQEIYVTNTLYKGVAVPALTPGDELQVSFAQHISLIPGTYFVSLGFVYVENSNLVPMDRRYDVVEMLVLARDGDRSTGIADLQSQITVTDLAATKNDEDPSLPRTALE